MKLLFSLLCLMTFLGGCTVRSFPSGSPNACTSMCLEDAPKKCKEDTECYLRLVETCTTQCAKLPYGEGKQQ
jgi:hypothetical protein